MIYREDRWDFRRPGGYSSQFRLSCRARCPYSVFLRKPDRRTRLNPFIIIYVIRYIVIASHVRISNGPQALRTFQLCPLVIFNSIAIYKILQSVLSRFYHYVCVFPSIHKFSSRRFFLRSCVDNAFPRHFYNCRVLLFFLFFSNSVLCGLNWFGRARQFVTRPCLGPSPLVVLNVKKENQSSAF